jgi:hypothetical protein
MKPKTKIALSIFTFVAMVLTGLAAAEQVPTKAPHGSETLLSPNIFSLSPKLIRKKDQFEPDAKTIREMDSVLINRKPSN